jgi:hypothetical protein
VRGEACQPLAGQRRRWAFFRNLLEEFYFDYIAGMEGESISHVDRGNKLHLILGIVCDTWENDGPFDFPGDQNGIALGAAEGSLLGCDFDPFLCLDGLESLEIVGFRDLEVERTGKGVYGEFAGKLGLDPRDLGEIRSHPDALYYFSANFN